MSRVSGHTRVVNGRRVRVQQHTRTGGGAAARRGVKLRPDRAWKNIKRSHRAFRGGYNAAGLCWGTTAVVEFTGWFVFKAAGGLLAVVGIAGAAAGAAMLKRTA